MRLKSDAARWTACAAVVFAPALARGATASNIYSYDPAGRVVAVGTTAGQVTIYAYDAAGNRTSAVTTAANKPIANSANWSIATNAATTAAPLAFTGGAPSSVALGTLPLHGVATPAGATITYKPNTGYAGPDSFGYSGTNAIGPSGTATVSIFVGMLTANPVIATVPFNAAATSVPLNIVGGTATSVAVSTQASHGIATATGVAITYKPTVGYFGPDAFAYTASNAAGTSLPAVATITVSNPATPKRYWGMRANTPLGVSYGELGFEAADGGPNLAAGLPPQSNTAYFTNQFGEYDGAIGVGSNTWNSANANLSHSGATSPSIDYVDFGGGAPQAINQMRLTSLESTFTSGMPTTFDVVSSNDGVNWTTEWSGTAASWVQAEVRTYTRPAYAPVYAGSKYGAHGFWRVSMYSNGGYPNSYAVAELQMRATPGGATQTTGGVCAESDQFSTFGCAAAFDGNATSFWTSLTRKFGNYLQYNFASPVAVGEIAVTAINNNGPATPIDMLLWFSDDGAKWSPAWHIVTPATWAVGETRVFTDPDYH